MTISLDCTDKLTLGAFRMNFSLTWNSISLALSEKKKLSDHREEMIATVEIHCWNQELVMRFLNWRIFFLLFNEVNYLSFLAGSTSPFLNLLKVAENVFSLYGRNKKLYLDIY